MSLCSMSSVNISGAHLKVTRTLSRPRTANIFPQTLKHKASSHCNFSVASGKLKQNSRILAAFIGGFVYDTLQPRLASHARISRLRTNLRTYAVNRNEANVAPYGIRQLWFSDPDGYGLCLQ